MSELPTVVYYVIGPYGWVFSDDYAKLRREYGRLRVYRSKLDPQTRKDDEGDVRKEWCGR
jgi:hypothetical protein